MCYSLQVQIFPCPQLTLFNSRRVIKPLKDLSAVITMKLATTAILTTAHHQPASSLILTRGGPLWTPSHQLHPMLQNLPSCFCPLSVHFDLIWAIPEGLNPQVIINVLLAIG